MVARNEKIRQETGYNKPSELAVEVFMKKDPTIGLEMEIGHCPTNEMKIRQETGYHKSSGLVVVMFMKKDLRDER